MIEKAVFSYYNAQDSYSHRAGFPSFKSLLYTTALSVLCASRHFKEVQFVSNGWGVNLFRDLEFPVTTYSTLLNEMKGVSRFFWAYGKLMTYCDQKTPFVHLDNDVFLWDPLPKRILEAELCFQSHEPMHLEGYKYYRMLKKPWSEAQVRPQKIVDNEVTDFAYNCGICGGHNLEFFHEWKACSEEYIFAEANQELFFNKYVKILIHQNLFHEQYFAAALIKMHDMRKRVKVLAADAMKIEKKLKYTHLWGNTKMDASMMRRVELRLMVEDRPLHDRIEKFVKKNKL